MVVDGAVLKQTRITPTEVAQADGMDRATQVSLCTAHNNSPIHGVPLSTVQSTMMGRSQHVGGL